MDYKEVLSWLSLRIEELAISAKLNKFAELERFYLMKNYNELAKEYEQVCGVKIEGY